MTTLERWVQRHSRRLAFGRFLERFAEWFAGFLFAFGAIVLLVKLLSPELWPQVLWIGLAAIPVTIAAWSISRRSPYSRTESIAMIDRKLDAGGLLMTLSEKPDEEWAERLPVESAWKNVLPKLRPVRVARFLLLPLAFAAAACLIPPREARTELVRPNVVGREAADQLGESLKLLEEANVLEEKDEKELREAIEKLAIETENTPLTHEKWETVDALREKLRMRADSASLVVAQGESAAAALSAAMEQDGEPLSSERMERLEQDVLEALKKLSAGGQLPGQSTELGKKLSKLASTGKLQLSKDSAERKKTLGELKDFLQKESKKLGECRSQCCGSCSGEGCKVCKDGFCLTPGSNQSGLPGRGGVTRGRADAELNFGEESDDANTKFKELALPPGFLDDPQNDIKAVTMAPPEVNPAESAPRAALRPDDPATGKETWNRPLRPRHRAVVRNYFGSGAPSGNVGKTEANP
ncbi:MAG: hypothetical protein AB7O26_16275 [Planctomycetaceae bacterium]